MRLWPIALLLYAGAAHAQSVKLRMAALAPEGTAWAREMHALSREIEAETRGEVELKWYLGGIAGDELTVLDRIRKGQLDGTAGALFCERLAPSFRVGRVVGLFQSRDESTYVLGSLRNELNAEFAKSGFVSLGTGSFGNMVLFTQKPVRSLAELKRQRLWTYDIDELLLSTLTAMGANMVPLPVGEGLRAIDEGRVDGFLTSPTVALAFQWSSRVHYYTDLTVSMLPACMVVSQRAFDVLPLGYQKIVRAAAAKFVARFEDVGHTQEQRLLGEVFERQGIKRVPMDPAARDDFFDAAQRARAMLDANLVSPQLIARVLGMLADYRAVHGPSRTPRP